MAYRLDEDVSDNDLYEIAHMTYAALQRPAQSMMPIIFHVDEAKGATAEAAIKRFAEGQIAARKAADPNHRWIKVVETSSNQIVGAALYIACEQNPFANGPLPRREALHQPEGPDRDIVTSLIAQLGVYRAAWMTKPHLFLSLCFTDPDHRRRGIGAMLMAWGNAYADERDWEIFVNGSASGVLLYSKFGYVAAPPYVVTFDELQPSERLELLKARMLPVDAIPMVRPVQGQYRKGQMPWEITSV